MTQTTDARQLKLLVDGVLSVHGIDNLQLTMDLCAALKKLIGADAPSRTREQILASLKTTMERGQVKQQRLTSIREELAKRLRISPTGQDWEDFIVWAEKQDGSITVFLDWWLADDWRAQHPPFKPTNFYVMWPQAFEKQERKVEVNKFSSLERFL